MHPSPLVRIGQGEGGGAPFLLSLLFPPSRILFQLGKGGILLPVGVGLLLRLPSLAGQPLWAGQGGVGFLLLVGVGFHLS